MMSRKISLLFVIALVCLIFIGSIQSAPVDKRTDGTVGEVAFADFKKATGRSTVTQIMANTVQFVGQWNDKFKDPNINNYDFKIKDSKGNVVMDLTKPVRKQVTINPPGTTPYSINAKGMNVCDMVGKIFEVSHLGKVGDTAKFQKAQ